MATDLQNLSYLPQIARVTCTLANTAYRVNVSAYRASKITLAPIASAAKFHTDPTLVDGVTSTTTTPYIPLPADLCTEATAFGKHIQQGIGDGASQTFFSVSSATAGCVIDIMIEGDDGRH